MKIRGKIAVWFWIIYLGGTAGMLYELFFSRDSLAALLVGFVIFQVVFLPILIRNYVRVEKDVLTVCFGFGKDSVSIEEILEVYSTHDPIASSAESLDRIVIRSRRKEMMCAVQEKERLFGELKRINPKIRFR